MRDDSAARDKVRAATCCVAGHRNIPDSQVEWVKRELMREVAEAIGEGYRYFLTDFMEGADQLFAEVVKEMRESNDQIRLEAVIPYRGRVKKLMGDKETAPLIAACTEVGVWGEKYTPGCYTNCRRMQLERSSRMIVVFDGRAKGGTIKAIRMAHTKRVQIKEIALGL